MIEASMEDQQPPDKAAMVEDQQPPGDAAMLEVKQPPGEAVMVEGQQKKPDEAVAMVEDQQQQLEKAAMARYPAEEVAKTVGFLNEITASLEASRGVRDGLLDLLAGFGKGGGDKRAVTSRVAELLGGHPDVLARFTAFINRTKAPAVAPGPLAVTRPRRSSTRNKNERDGARCRTLPAVKEEPDAQDCGSPPSKGAGGRKRDDPRIAEAEAFLKRVLETAGREVCGKLVAALNLHAAGDQFADVIYGDVKEALGPAHAALLCEFASTFLPGQKEWDEQARREAQRNRRRVAAATRRAAAAADDQNPPRAAADDYDDGNHRKNGLRVGGESSGGGGTAGHGKFDRYHATLVVTKKRRTDGGGDHRGHDEDNYAPRDRTKKPRTDTGGGGHRRHAVGSNGNPSCSGAAARVLDAGVHGHGDKKPRRRAPNGGKGSSAAAAAAPGEEPSKKDALYRGFRKLWVFYTRYSTLVETIERVRKLLRGGGGGGFPASVEELFPHREHRELLGGYYGDRWGQVRAALEGADSTGPALEAVLRMLKAREVEAVVEEARARRRNDAERAVERIVGLVADRVRLEERR